MQLSTSPCMYGSCLLESGWCVCRSVQRIHQRTVKQVFAALMPSLGYIRCSFQTMVHSVQRQLTTSTFLSLAGKKLRVFSSVGTVDFMLGPAGPAEPVVRAVIRACAPGALDASLLLVNAWSSTGGGRRTTLCPVAHRGTRPELRASTDVGGSHQDAAGPGPGSIALLLSSGSLVGSRLGGCGGVTQRSRVSSAAQGVQAWQQQRCYSVHGMSPVMLRAEQAREVLSAICAQHASYAELADRLSETYSPELFEAISGLVRSHLASPTKGKGAHLSLRAAPLTRHAGMHACTRRLAVVRRHLPARPAKMGANALAWQHCPCKAGACAPLPSGFRPEPCSDRATSVSTMPAHAGRQAIRVHASRCALAACTAGMELANVLWAFATVGHLDRGLFHDIAQASSCSQARAAADLQFRPIACADPAIAQPTLLAMQASRMAIDAVWHTCA